MHLIRDAEIETTIRAYATPLWEAARLDPNVIEVVIVDDKNLNAFVAGGQRIFINTGLLLATETPNQLIGVIAHESGHIVGGHLARAQEALRNASTPALIALLMGAAAAVAGSGQAAGALIVGGVSVSQGTIMQYSRTQEGVADQSAVRFLEATGQSPLGLMQFLEKLGDQELLEPGSLPPYLRTHPLSRERVESLRAQVRVSRFKDAPDPPAFVAMHARMRAKLYGYVNNAAQTLRKYPLSDTSLPARYARAVTLHYQARQSDQALRVIDGLIADWPDDPYFHELKGEILLDTQRVDEAVVALARAVELHPDNALLRLGLGQAQASSTSTANVKDAIENLKAASRIEPHNPGVWHWLATAYARDDQLAMAALATAERYVLNGEYRDAVLQANKAKQGLPVGSPARLRAEDIEAQAEREVKKKNER